MVKRQFIAGASAMHLSQVAQSPWITHPGVVVVGEVGGVEQDQVHGASAARRSDRNTVAVARTPDAVHNTSKADNRSTVRARDSQVCQPQAL